MTATERLISEVLPAGWVWNYPVALGKRQQGFPTNYKLDFAWPHLKLGLEVDGNSHTALARQQQDRKKETKLETLGWRVLRISNVQAASMYSTSKLREHLTTLLGITG
jgi:very-short-patch-repair endonuclease